MPEIYDQFFIGVHPFIPLHPTNPDISLTYDDQPDFVKVRNQRLYDSGGNQLLLVDKVLVKQTVYRFGLDRPSWEGRIIPTKFADPTPVGISWGDLRQDILEEFPAQNYIIWGAELLMHRGQGAWGCVKYAFDKLQLPNSEIDYNGSWKQDVSWPRVQQHRFNYFVSRILSR